MNFLEVVNDLIEASSTELVDETIIVHMTPADKLKQKLKRKKPAYKLWLKRYKKKRKRPGYRPDLKRSRTQKRISKLKRRTG